MQPPPFNPHLARRQWLVGSGLLLAGAHRTSQASAPSIQLLAGHVPPLSQELGGWLNPRVMAIAKAAGHRAPVSFLPWHRAMRDAQEGGHALIYPVARTPERERNWQWLAHLSTDEAVLLVRKDAVPDPSTLRSPLVLHKLRIGTLRDSLHALRLQNEGVKSLDFAPNEEANARKLGAGRIQAWAVTRSVADYLLEREQIDRSLLHPPVRRGMLALYLAASLDLSDAALRPWHLALSATPPSARG